MYLPPRQMRNCLPCKKRKIKCDRKIPCGPCALRSDADACTPAAVLLDESPPPHEQDHSVTPAAFKALSHNVDQLQKRVRALEAALSHAPTGPPTPLAAPAGSSRRHVGDDEMVFELEDFQMNHRINTIRNMDTYDTGTTVVYAPNTIDESHPLSFLIPPGTDYVAAALATLPDQPRCEYLVEQYFEHAEWFQRCLHYPTFLQQCRRLWANPTATHRPDFVCAYIMVVCLALRDTDMVLADRLYRVAEGVLECSRFLYRQTLSSLQAISLMSIYGFGTEDGADATWALLGAAIKIAQNLGLNRLEAETPDKTWAPVWASRLKREIGRRLWWTFVALDWSHAIAHGSTYCIHPAQNLTVFPSNLRDDELDDPDAAPQPMSVYTPISMQIFRFQFVQVYREITDHMAAHPDPPYTFIEAMHEKIVDLASTLPDHFRRPERLVQPTRALMVDSIFLNLLVNIRLARLHRPYFLRGYHDKRYLDSKERCVKASQEVLRLVDLAEHRCPQILSLWLPLFYAFTAAVPVCIDLVFEPTDGKRRAAEGVLETFRKHSATSVSARHSAFVIERMLALQVAPSAKRRRVDNDDDNESVPGGGDVDVAMLKSKIKSILESAIHGPPQASSANDAEPVSWELNDQLFNLFDSGDVLNILWSQTEAVWPTMQ